MTFCRQLAHLQKVLCRCLFVCLSLQHRHNLICKEHQLNEAPLEYVEVLVGNVNPILKKCHKLNIICLTVAFSRCYTLEVVTVSTVTVWMVRAGHWAGWRWWSQWSHDAKLCSVPGPCCCCCRGYTAILQPPPARQCIGAEDQYVYITPRINHQYALHALFTCCKPDRKTNDKCLIFLC